MYRFLLSPRWIVFHVVVLAAIVTMVNLGFWQLDRLSERQDFNDTVIERTERAPVPIEELLGPGGYDPDDDEWTPVRMSGTYLPDQLVEFNQSQGGRAGENVLTALALDSPSDATVIVNRGFKPLEAAVPDPPATIVDVIGLVRASEVRDRGGLTDPEAEVLTEVRRVDVELIARQLPGDVAPFSVQLVAQDPAVAAGDPEPVVRPELDDGPHLSYAVQWFIFAVCVAIGWVLAVQRSIRARRRTTNEPPAGSGSNDASESSEVAGQELSA